MSDRRVLVFGDSIAWGGYDSEGGWADRLKRQLIHDYLAGGPKQQLINLGIGGDTSTGVLKRLRPEIEARKKDKCPMVLVFWFGTNDTREVAGKVETPIEQFEDNVTNIIATARAYTDRIIFCGIPPLPKPQVELNGKAYDAARISEYESTLAVIVGAADLPYVPIRQHFEAKGTAGLFTADNLHPNDAGHELIAKAVHPVLTELLAGKA